MERHVSRKRDYAKSVWGWVSQFVPNGLLLLVRWWCAQGIYRISAVRGVDMYPLYGYRTQGTRGKERCNVVTLITLNYLLYKITVPYYTRLSLTEY